MGVRVGHVHRVSYRREVGLGVELLPAVDGVLGLERAVAEEGLNAAVAGIGDEQLTGVVDGEADGLDELARRRAVASPVLQRLGRRR